MHNVCDGHLNCAVSGNSMQILDYSGNELIDKFTMGQDSSDLLMSQHFAATDSWECHIKAKITVGFGKVPWVKINWQCCNCTQWRNLDWKKVLLKAFVRWLNPSFQLAAGREAEVRKKTENQQRQQWHGEKGFQQQNRKTKQAGLWRCKMNVDYKKKRSW